MSSASDRIQTAVVGAGPFGLSVAAHLQTPGVRTFGREMATWRDRMPRYMTMRSAWHETSLSAARGRGTIDEWCAEVGEQRTEPIPLELFIRYSTWFADTFVPDRDPHDVQSIERHRDGYRVTTTAGDAVDTTNIVIAVGVTPFAYVPSELTELVGHGVSLATNDPNDMIRFAGKRVLVIGGGQAGLETAGLAASAGARVDLVSRSAIRWFADREPHTPRGPIASRLYRIAYPAIGYGPPPFNRLVLHPDLYAALPLGAKSRLTGRLLRPGGSPSLRPAVEGHVGLTEHCTVLRADRDGESVVVTLSNGHVDSFDEILVACGYRFDLDRLSFLSDEVRSTIEVRNGWPVLDRNFRSSAPNILFAGFAAEGRFGPISRFVLGAGFTATRIGGLLG